MQVTIEHQAHLLLFNGMLLFLLGLLNGAAVQVFKNKRMGLSAHLTGVQNGMVLLLFGFLWPHVSLSAGLLCASWWLSLYSMYVIWFALVLAAAWGSSRSTPIAGAGFQATKSQELIVQVLLVPASLAIIVAAGVLLWGLV